MTKSDSILFNGDTLMMHFLISECFIRSWWVIAFIFLCGILYEKGIEQRNSHYWELREKLSVLKKKKQEGLDTQQDLILRLNSQSDRAWVELILIKGLGLVPDNQKKVYFYEEESTEL